MKADMVQTQSWCYKTTVVIMRQQQATLNLYLSLFIAKNVCFCIKSNLLGVVGQSSNFGCYIGFRTKWR